MRFKLICGVASVLAASSSASSSGSGMGDGGTTPVLAISFDDPNVNYTLTGFGEEIGTVVADPTDPTNKVGKVDKPVTSPLWAGTTVSTLPNRDLLSGPDVREERVGAREAGSGAR